MKQFVSRWGCLFIGMSSVAFGIAMTTRAGLGTTPLSSSPYTVTFFTPLTLGAASIGLNVFFFALLWAVMGKRFQFTRNLLQVPIVLLFGFLIDFFMWALAAVPPGPYAAKIAQNLLGNAFLALGVVFQGASCAVPLPGDGFVIEASKRFGISLGRMKAIFDWSLVAIACVLGLIFLGRIEGVREGTVIFALTTGIFVRLWAKCPVFSKLVKFNRLK